MIRLLSRIFNRAGFSVLTIADWFDMRENTLYEWFDRPGVGPIDQAIYDDAPSGRPPALDHQQKQQLKDVLRESPREIGHDEPAWVPRLARRYMNGAFTEIRGESPRLESWDESDHARHNSSSIADRGLMEANHLI